MSARYMVNQYKVGLLLWGIALLAACSGASDAPGEMELTSTAFQDGADIPAKYSCDGADISPPLQWRGLPGGTVSLALIMDDPDAPGRTWVHWIAYDLPGDATGLPEGVTRAETVDGGRQGNSSWNRLGYGGPCPPRGSHRYFFKLYALDTRLELEPGVTKDALLSAMEGHILGETQLMGRYERS
jgi:Raf kinase inhibitor-like YbhB/YbcL family protein